MTRVFVCPGALEDRFAWYELLQNAVADARISLPTAGLRLAVVGMYLLIEGRDAALEPFRNE